MSDFDFNRIELSGEYEWPQRGRQAKEFNPALVTAIQQSYQDGKVATLIIRNEEVKRFGALLGKVGAKYNFRIERDIHPDKPQEGFTTYGFRAKAKHTNKEVKV